MISTLDMAMSFLINYRVRMIYCRFMFISLLTGLLAGPIHGFESHEMIEARIDAIWEQVEEIEAARDSEWLTRSRSDDIRNIVQDVIADADTRTSLQGSNGIIGYDDGYFVRTPDNKFLLKLRGQLQFRWIMDHRNKMPGQDYGNEDVDQFELRRSKLHFYGHIFDPSFSYRLTLATNTRTLANSGESTVFIENAFIQKSFENGMFVRLGQYKGPYLREEMVPSAYQLAVERSMVNHAFTYAWTQGLELGWDVHPFHLRVMYNDGPRQLNVGAYQTLMNSILARAEVVLAGEYADFRTLTTKDADEFGLMIGAGFQWYTLKNSDTEWVYANVEADRSLGFTMDISMFDEGWTAFSYFVWGNGQNTSLGLDQEAVDSWGWVGQAGITVHENVQLYSRYELGDIGDYRGSLQLPGQTGHLSTLTTGFNWWPIGIQDVKVTCDFGYSFSNIAAGPGVNQDPANSSTNPGSAFWPGRGNGWRPDYGNQSGQWLIRAQLQYEF
ncbi:MAG: porin [Phycisphaerales bacterium]|nr:porin [Phycisphaerales bacterium]